MRKRKQREILGTIDAHATQQAIDSAERNNAGHCVVAQSIRLTDPAFTSVRVTAETASFNYNGWRYSYPVPATVAKNVVAFDKGAEIKPFKIKLQNPYLRPVLESPGKSHTGPRKRRKKRGPVACKRECVRRYHGLKIITEKA